MHISKGLLLKLKFKEHIYILFHTNVCISDLKMTVVSTNVCSINGNLLEVFLYYYTIIFQEIPLCGILASEPTQINLS